MRGVQVRRVKAVTVVGRGATLKCRRHTAIMESFLADPMGELNIAVPPEEIDEFATVFAIDIADPE